MAQRVLAGVVGILVWITIIFSGHLYGQSKSFTTKLWKFETEGKIFASPLAHDNAVYFGSSDHSFYAVDAKKGHLIWSFETGGAVNSNAVIDGDLIFFGSGDGSYYALDYKSGSLAWRFETGGEMVYGPWDYYLSTPVVSGDLVYFGSGDKNIYALDKKTGQAVWKFETGDIVHSRGEVYKDKIYFGSFDGYMYALNNETGELIWKFNTVGNRYFPKGEIQGSATVRNNIIYFGSRDYILYALNAEDGTGIWIEETPSWVIAKPMIEDGVLYFGNSDAPHCYAFDAENGRKLWEHPVLLNIFGSALVSTNEVFYPSFDGKIYALDKETGQFKYTVESDLAGRNFTNIFTDENKIKPSILEEANETGDFGKVYDLFYTLGSVMSQPVIEDEILYFTSTDSSLYAYSH